jgi:hypothetical protein
VAGTAPELVWMLSEVKSNHQGVQTVENIWKNRSIYAVN